MRLHHILASTLVILLSWGILRAQEPQESQDQPESQTQQAPRESLESILENVDRCRVMHDPEMARAWSASLYSKVELDATRLEGIVNSGLLRKSLGFVTEYGDTSTITGQKFLPFMISETRSDFYHSLEPVMDREIIRANRISGAETDNIMSQFSGDGVMKANFYRSFVHMLDMDIPSPLAVAENSSYYSYFLIDSLQVNGRQTWRISFLPKRDFQAPVFEGDMYIDAESYALTAIKASLSPNSNVNWIRYMVLDFRNKLLPEGVWFYDKEDLYLGFSPTKGKFTTIDVLGHRQVEFGTPVFGPITDPDALSSKNSIEMSHMQEYDDEWWDQSRFSPLTSHEEGIYEMVDRVQASTPYKIVYSLTDMFSTGYLQNKDIGIGIGPWAKAITFNDTEGLRTQIGFRTTKELSYNYRLAGYLAYGWKDKEFKGRASAEIMFRRDLTRKLNLIYKKDFAQLGQGTGLLKENNIFNSLLAKGSYNKQSMVQSISAEYLHEFNPSINSSFSIENRKMWSNDEVPMLKVDGSLDPSFYTNTLKFTTRFSWDETVSRKVFTKSYIYTRYPIITLSVAGGDFGTTFLGDWNNNLFLKPEFQFDWNTPSGPMGSGMLHMDGGTIIGDVPYPLLKVHEGNETMFHNRLSFACMDYYEYASDSWVSWCYEHNFNGLVLGQIPLVKKLKLREMVTFRGTWGTISQDNLNGPYMLLPLTKGIGPVPYMEAGVGISNLFKVVRFDAFWRLTHRDEGSRNFAFNIGIDLNF